MRRVLIAIPALVVVAVAGAAALAWPPDEPPTAIPAAFAPFEHLVGAWKGMGIPAANRLKGWPERHLWAWKFARGTPVGMSLQVEGGKVLSKGQLAHDAATRTYTLEGTDPAGKPVVFAGTMDPAGKVLTLTRREAAADGGKDRLILRLNSNMIRYTMNLEHQEPGAPQFSRTIDMNMGKEGEAFASTSAAASLPKCIITGGAATMTVSYEGKSYPLCCSGCRDEFLENPAKYVKLAALKSQASDKGTEKAKAAPASLRKDDGAFDGLVDDPPAPKPRAQPAKAADKAASAAAPTASKDEAPAKAAAKAAPATDANTRAAALLRSAQSLEKLGKASAAVTYYKQVVARYPGTPQAKTAAERIKALGK